MFDFNIFAWFVSWWILFILNLIPKLIAIIYNQFSHSSIVRVLKIAVKPKMEQNTERIE